MHDTSQVDHEILFSHETMINMCPKPPSDFTTSWKGFKQDLIVGKYLGVALNSLSLLWRLQNIVNKSKMADSSLILVRISSEVKIL